MRLVGRRIKIINPEDSLGTLGKIGIVVKSDYPNNNFDCFCIAIKDWDQGHNGEQKDRNIRNRWYFSRGAFRLLPRRKRASR